MRLLLVIDEARGTLENCPKINIEGRRVCARHCVSVLSGAGNCEVMEQCVINLSLNQENIYCHEGQIETL